MFKLFICLGPKEGTHKALLIVFHFLSEYKKNQNAVMTKLDLTQTILKDTRE